MPNINQMKQSKFLKKEDCGQTGILVTITNISEMNVALPSAPEEYKWCAHFQEVETPLVLNSTNLQIMASVFGSPETDDWIGKKVVLYNDPTVSYQGKLMGGVRCRAPRVKPAQAAQPVQAQKPVQQPQTSAPVDSDDIPF